ELPERSGVVLIAWHQLQVVARGPDRVERAEHSRVRAHARGQPGALSNLLDVVLHDREGEREARVLPQDLQLVEDAFESARPTNGVVGLRRRAVEAHIEPRELALAELARDRLRDQEAI